MNDNETIKQAMSLLGKRSAEARKKRAGGMKAYREEMKQMRIKGVDKSLHD